MRIRRSVSRFFGLLVVPAITLAVVSYFTAYTVWGNRGMLVLEDTQAKLGIQQEKLAQLNDGNSRLAHRIVLMNRNDADLLEEQARGQLLDGAPNQVAIPRDRH